MIAIITFFILAVALPGSLGLLGLAAWRWGVDSRPTVGDDHAR
ncbi:MAG: hypothetical protein HW391_739 [Chloroflexi bacterium]|nr:hypothetical protein [Chloroflexota bacterium]